MQDDELTNKRILVTGGAGVIGQSLLKKLLKRGGIVVSVDRQPLSFPPMDGLSHMELDVANGELGALRDFEPHVIFHLAATFERSTESAEFFDHNWKDNVVLNHRMLELATALKSVDTFVFASSYLLYSPSLYLSPMPKSTPRFLREHDQINPRNLCGMAKFYMERELEFLRESQAHMFRTISARIFRVYGLGSRDILSRWVRMALEGQILELYNQENRFDFIFADDVAEGLIRLAGNPLAEGAVNLGSGESHSPQEVLAVMTAHFPDLSEKIQDRGSIEQFESSGADLGKLLEMTGWKPSTELHKGIEALIQYERERHCEAVGR